MESSTKVQGGFLLGPQPLIASPAKVRDVRRTHLVRQVIILLCAYAAFLLHQYLPETLPPALDITIDFGVVVVAVAVSALFAFRAGAREAEVLRSAASILDSLPVGVALVDREFRFSYANPSLARLLAVRPAELLGKQTLAFTHGSDAERVKAERARHQAGTSSTYQRRMVGAGGAPVSTVVVVEPFMRGGTFDGELLVFIDLTELAAAQAQAEHFQKLSGFLFDAVTHDLSNSLQVVFGLVQVGEARTRSSDATTATVLSRAGAAALRSAQLVREVKLIALAEGAHWPMEPLTLGALAERAIAMADVPASFHVAAEMSDETAGRSTAANELAPLALAKMIEESADFDTAGVAGLELVIGVRGGLDAQDRADLVVRGCRRQHRPEDIAGALAAPASRETGGTVWRSGVKLALASAIAEAHGWSLHAEPASGGTEFSLRGIVLDPMAAPLPRASPPGQAGAPDMLGAEADQTGGRSKGPVIAV